MERCEILIKKIASKLGYEGNKPLEFLNKRVCGLWLIWVGITILAASIVGGQYLINPVIFCIGYFVGFVFILGSKSIRKRYSFGPPSKFQSKMINVSITFMFVLMVLISGRYFSVHDYRLIWLGAFLATAIHFIPFATVHGRILILLSIPLIIISVLGIMDPAISFIEIAIADGVTKIIFGLLMFLSKDPRIVAKVKNTVSQKSKNF